MGLFLLLGPALGWASQGQGHLIRAASFPPRPLLCCGPQASNALDTFAQDSPQELLLQRYVRRVSRSVSASRKGQEAKGVRPSDLC